MYDFKSSKYCWRIRKMDDSTSINKTAVVEHKHPLSEQDVARSNSHIESNSATLQPTLQPTTISAIKLNQRWSNCDDC